MAESLKNKTISGTFWSAADAFLGQGVTFVVGIVLARLLSPVEYGLIGVCTIFTVVLSGVVDSGFSTALIRKKDASNDDYCTMFITNMVISILMYIALYMVSPYIAVFFNREELVDIIRVMGLILIFQALSIVQITILTKRIDFKTKTKASLISAISSGVIGIMMAFKGFGVWALVGQQLSKNLLYTICLWFFNKWRPSLVFCNSSFHYMWSFGWKMMASGLLNNIWGQFYSVVVGKFYSPATLGQYSRSSEYASIFSSNFTAIIQRVTYPVLSEVQDDHDRLIAGYRQVIKITMFITAISMFFLGAISEPLLYCLIGPKWYEAATYLPLICIASSAYPLQAINLNMLQVQGRSDLFLGLEVIKKAIFLGPLLIGAFVGILPMLYANLLATIIAFFLNSHYSGKFVGYSSWMQLRDISPSYAIAIMISFTIYFMKYLPISFWYVLPMQILLGVGLLFIICHLFQPNEYLDLKEIVISHIHQINKNIHEK